MVQTEQASRHLVEFIRQGWSSVEPRPFVPGWHIEAICEALEAVTAGSLKRLLITVPPRHMKSLAVSVFWPAWAWGPRARPGLRFLFASYARALSVRDSVRCRRVLESPWFQARWGDRFRLCFDQNTKARFDTDEGGYRLATSVDGALTGEGGDIVVVDDPHNVRRVPSANVRAATLAWWDEAMSTRLNDPRTGAFVVIMQRVHEQDLAGHILARDHDWEHLCLPARFEAAHPQRWLRDPRRREGELLWPRRFDEPVIAELEARLGSAAAAGQLQQRPRPRSGGLFEQHWFKIVEAAPAEAARVRFWDKAATRAGAGRDPDWTVGARMALSGGTYWIEDVRRLRGTPGEVERQVRQSAELDGVAVPIWIEEEPGSAGKADIAHFVRDVLPGFAARGARTTGAKESRADPFAAAAEAGNVHLLKGAWNRAFLEELAAFPNGAHDDQVDAASGAFGKLAPRHLPRIWTA